MAIFGKKNPFGLDISDFSIEALQFKKQAGKVAMLAHGRVELEPGIVENGKIVDRERFKEKIKEFLPERKLKRMKTRKVIFSLPESRTFLHIFKLPLDIADEQLSKAIEERALKTIPLEPDKIYFDFQVISRKKSFIEILYVATTKEIVDEYLEVLREAGLEPLVLDIESASLSRAFKNEQVLDGGMLIMDIGARTTVLTLFDKETIRISSIVPIAGNHFSKEIAKKLSVSLEEAEELKKNCGLDGEKEGGRVMFILQEALNDILNEAKGIIRFYEQKEKRVVKKVVLCGGSSLIPKIVSYFSSNLGIETKLGDPSLIYPGLNKIKAKPAKLHPVLFSNVVGLALRALEEDLESSGINLIPAKERYKSVPSEKKFKKNKFFKFFVAAIFLLTLCFFGWVIYNYVLKPSLTEPEVGTPIVEEEPLPEEEIPEEIPLPTSLFPIKELEVLELEEREEIPSLIGQFLEEEIREGVFVRILIKDLKENKFLGLREFLEAIEVKAPDDFYSSLGNEFTLFVFSQKEGKRVGFVASIFEEGFEKTLRDWEPTMEEDFDSLFVLMNKKDPALVSYFKDTSYNGETIRYQTFSRQDLGICYSLFEDYFVFTSSFESIKTALDSLEME